MYIYIYTNMTGYSWYTVDVYLSWHYIWMLVRLKHTLTKCLFFKMCAKYPIPAIRVQRSPLMDSWEWYQRSTSEILWSFEMALNSHSMLFPFLYFFLGDVLPSTMMVNHPSITIWENVLLVPTIVGKFKPCGLSFGTFQKQYNQVKDEDSHHRHPHSNIVKRCQKLNYGEFSAAKHWSVSSFSMLAELNMT